MSKPKSNKKVEISWERPDVSLLQSKILDNPERIIAVLASTKSGKTYAAVLKVIENAINGKSNIWISSTFSRARTAFDLAEKWLKEAVEVGCVSFNRSEYSVKFVTGGSIHFHSGDSVDTLAGAEASGCVVLDEAARQPEGSFMLARTHIAPYPTAQMLLLANADKTNSNWFIRLFNRIRNGDLNNAIALSETAYETPFMTKQEIDQAKQLYPENIFKALYLAEPLTDESSVFGDLSKVLGGSLKPPDIGHEYALAWDIAKLVDRSIMIVIDLGTKEIVDFHAIRYMPYTKQAEKAANLSKSYNNCRIIYDETGVGQAVGDILKAKGVPVEGYLFTNKSKSELVWHATTLIEQGAFKMPTIQLLVDELKSYEFKESQGGNLLFSAPSGGSDDAVTALMLALWKIKHSVMTTQNLKYYVAPCVYQGEISLGV